MFRCNPDQPGRLVQYFGAGTEHVSRVAMTPDSSAANYMLFRGGTLQFGKMFMVHADMQVVDAEPGDPFDFDIARYREQLVAGYSRTLPDDGLLVFMPDLAKAPATRALDSDALRDVPRPDSSLDRLDHHRP